MENLSSKEIDILIEALESWENKDFGSQVMAGMMRTMLLPKDVSPEIKAEWEEKERLQDEKYEIEKRQRKEVSLLLKAKLIMIKRDSSIEHLMENNHG